MNIGRLWDRLEPGTRQWFIDNPGCRIVPRTIVAAISKATGARLEQDRHGEVLLSPADCDFIRHIAHRHPAAVFTPTGRRHHTGRQPESDRTGSRKTGSDYTGYVCRACGHPALTARSLPSAVPGTGRTGNRGTDTGALYCPDPRCPNSIIRDNGRLGFTRGEEKRS